MEIIGYISVEALVCPKATEIWDEGNHSIWVRNPQNNSPELLQPGDFIRAAFFDIDRPYAFESVIGPIVWDIEGLR